MSGTKAVEMRSAEAANRRPEGAVCLVSAVPRRHGGAVPPVLSLLALLVQKYEY